MRMAPRNTSRRAIFVLVSKSPAVGRQYCGLEMLGHFGADALHRGVGRCGGPVDLGAAAVTADPIAAADSSAATTVTSAVREAGVGMAIIAHSATASATSATQAAVPIRQAGVRAAVVAAEPTATAGPRASAVVGETGVASVATVVAGEADDVLTRELLRAGDGFRPFHLPIQRGPGLDHEVSAFSRSGKVEVANRSRCGKHRAAFGNAEQLDSPGALEIWVRVDPEPDVGELALGPQEQLKLPLVHLVDVGLGETVNQHVDRPPRNLLGTDRGRRLGAIELLPQSQRRQDCRHNCHDNDHPHL